MKSVKLSKYPEPMINKKQLFLGVLFLFAGTLEYLISRPLGSAHFLNPFNSITSYFHHLPSLYGKFGSFAPDFFHPLALSLICMALFSKTHGSRIAFCVAWFTIESMLEFGQKYGYHLFEYLPPGHRKVAMLDYLSNYFLYGVFDLGDILAIGLGSIAAYFIGQTTKTGGRRNPDAYQSILQRLA